jgi:hypothetical protein
LFPRVFLTIKAVISKLKCQISAIIAGLHFIGHFFKVYYTVKRQPMAIVLAVVIVQVGAKKPVSYFGQISLAGSMARLVSAIIAKAHVGFIEFVQRSI